MFFHEWFEGKKLIRIFWGDQGVSSTYPVHDALWICEQEVIWGYTSGSLWSDTQIWFSTTQYCHLIMPCTSIINFDIILVYVLAVILFVSIYMYIVHFYVYVFM